MKCCVLAVVATLVVTGTVSILVPGFRPPSVPIVVVDPYLSIWSNADHLYDDVPRHWTGAPVSLTGMIRIDGISYRFMANASDLPADNMLQTDLKVFPTQTVYVFERDGVRLNVTFSTPAFLSDDVAPYFPLTFITYNIDILDNDPHRVQLYYDNTAEIVSSDDSEVVVWDRPSVSDFVTLSVGNQNQCYLCQTSDRINWGYWYVSTSTIVHDNHTLTSTITNSTNARQSFARGGKLPPDDNIGPLPVSHSIVMALSWDFGIIQPSFKVTKHMSVAYDQVYSIQYFGTAMAPLWKLEFKNVPDLISTANYDQLKAWCDKTDLEVVNMVSKVGGDKYATIASLAWRQALGGTVLVWNNVTETMWMFMKEISSDGDVSTVDVLYPASPMFLLFNPNALKMLLLPVLDYANNQTGLYGISLPYNLAWAPHHLGRWPICLILSTMQEQMPVEESANMILMIAGIVHQSPGHDVEWIKPYWDVLLQWGDYMVSSLPDPGDQLCTDDFEGPSPNNVNLASKGIVGLAALSYILNLDGQNSTADVYDQLSKAYAGYWMLKAWDKDHYRLQYNLENTWSLKYNLFFQKFLNLDVFPESVFDVEEAYYFKNMNKYGIPIDNRADYTKADWEMWVAALGTEKQFSAIVDALYSFLDESPDRIPFTDWYFTSSPKKRGFMARPVVGGIFAKALLAINAK